MKQHLLIIGTLLASMSVSNAQAQISLVNPVPHKVITATSELSAAPTTWTIKADAARTSSFALKALEQTNIIVEPNASFTLTLGIKGDKAIKGYSKNAPQHAEGYWLKVTPQGAIVVGADEEGLYYGLQTLIASLAEGKLESCTVTDWPDVRWRGTVEGFYGTPWSHNARLSQIAFYGKNKMNVYIYGPKDDPYHRDHWREAYPDAEAQRIQQLNEQAKQHGVRFYWAIHPGIDIKWTTEDRNALLSKLEKMYALGIRSFAVFFDDIYGEGTKADKQAELLNYIDDHFVQKKKDVTPLIMCPTEYNRAWANDEKGYLRTLGTTLNKSVQIMWTGNSVVHCIDKESMEWINERIGRKAYIWWNFPVSDFVRDHILLGPAYGNGLDIANDMSGFVSNPMEHAEASKIALYGIADYTWNMQAYDANRDWAKALAAVLPHNTQALHTFALYSKDLGVNGHQFRREEGEELKDIAEAALQGNAEAIAQIAEESMKLKMAADILLNDDTNPALIRELRPWLLQAKNVGDYGQCVAMLALSTHTSPDSEAYPSFKDLYQQARSIQVQMFDLENSNVRHALQPGIKVGTKVMLPTLYQLFAQAVNAYNQANGTHLDSQAEYNPYQLKSDVAQLASLPISLRGSDIIIAPSNEVIRWQKGGSLLIESERTIELSGLSANLGVPDVAKHFKLEIFTGSTWKEVKLMYYRPTDTTIYAEDSIEGLKASKLRITNVSGNDLQVYFKSFKFSKQ